MQNDVITTLQSLRETIVQVYCTSTVVGISLLQIILLTLSRAMSARVLVTIGKPGVSKNGSTVIEGKNCLWGNLFSPALDRWCSMGSGSFIVT